MNDLQIVRSQNGGYNLALGEPFFLIDALKWTHNIPVNGPYYYPLFSGDKDLLEELQFLYPGKHIVVTNGAKQAIAASLYALKDLNNYTSVCLPAPYWLSYPTLIKAAGLMTEYGEIKNHKCLRVDTFINNPDGRLAKHEVDLLDCAYAHPVYGFNKETMSMPKHQASVWSAAKLFGLSGLRVGWAVFDNPDLAKRAAVFAEITTSGVSSISQQYMAKVLNNVRLNDDVSHQFDNARKVLLSNGEVFQSLVAPYCSDIKGVTASSTGMFAYFRTGDHAKFTTALNKVGIKTVTGEACGEKEPGWIRMSLGHRHDFTVEALEKLNAELRR